MAIDCYAGETVRITAQDLTHADDGAITSGATVVVNVYNAAGTLDSGPHSASNGGSGDDWYYDLAAPSTAGQYKVAVTATKDSAVGKATLLLTVKPFP